MTGMLRVDDAARRGGPCHANAPGDERRALPVLAVFGQRCPVVPCRVLLRVLR